MIPQRGDEHSWIPAVLYQSTRLMLSTTRHFNRSTFDDLFNLQLTPTPGLASPTFAQVWTNPWRGTTRRRSAPTPCLGRWTTWRTRCATSWQVRWWEPPTIFGHFQWRKTMVNQIWGKAQSQTQPYHILNFYQIHVCKPPRKMLRTKTIPQLSIMQEHSTKSSKNNRPTKKISSETWGSSASQRFLPNSGNPWLQAPGKIIFMTSFCIRMCNSPKRRRQFCDKNIRRCKSSDDAKKKGSKCISISIVYLYIYIYIHYDIYIYSC